MIKRTCLECGELLYGRCDKKFCDDYCRNLHNNKLNSDETNYIRKVNNSLRKNRRILQSLSSDAPNEVPRQKLADLGFNFTLYTASTGKKVGQACFFCYDYGYVPLKGNCVLIRNKNP
ncbi:MAG: hypothetical protein ACXVP0_00485 [Bacteroidia bacterium]